MPPSCFWHPPGPGRAQFSSHRHPYMVFRKLCSDILLWAPEKNVCSLSPGSQTGILVPVGFCATSLCRRLLFLSCPQEIHSFSSMSLTSYHSYFIKLIRQLVNPWKEKLYIFSHEAVNLLCLDMKGLEKHSLSFLILWNIGCKNKMRRWYAQYAGFKRPLQQKSWKRSQEVKSCHFTART